MRRLSRGVFTTLLTASWLLMPVVAVPVLPARQPAVAQDAGAPSASTAPEGTTEGVQIAAKAAILADAKSGDILFSRNDRTRLPVASLTKVVTALVARDRFALDETVTTPQEVTAVGGGKLGLEPGMRFTVHQMLSALLVMSGNDVAVALAAHDPLGVPAFVDAMNEKARSIGATRSTFTNPHGLDETGHLSSAFDMALFARRLLRDDVLAEIVAMKRVEIPWKDGTVRRLLNHNKLVLRNDDVIGVKTGFTNKAGRSLVAAANTPSGTAITVVLNSPSHYTDTETLIAYHGSGAAALPDVSLATPRPVRAAAADAALTNAGGIGRYRWVVFPMVLLSLVVLLTARRPERVPEQAARRPEPRGRSTEPRNLFERYVSAEDTQH